MRFVTHCALGVILLFAIHWSLSTTHADDDPLNRMRDETISYFKPMTGRVMMVVGDDLQREGGEVVVGLGIKDSVKPGMRFDILREGAPFIHPVTKEPLGRVEFSVGRLEIKKVGPDSSTGTTIAGDAKEGDKVRISETKVSMLFCRSKETDWYISDLYYRDLKEAGRFNILNTDIETDDPSKVIEEAKRLNAEVALLLTTSKTVESGLLITQRLFWVYDGLKFAEKDAEIDAAYVKELRSGEELFTPHEGKALLQLDLPSSVRLLTIGNIDGDEKQEIVISTGKDIRVYTLSIDPQPALGEAEIKGSALDSHIRLDLIDLNRNGKDEVVVTSMKGDDVTSYIYELSDRGFVLLYKENIFLRRVENRLIAQSYSGDEGFWGEVFSIEWAEGGYKKGSAVRLPRGVNIYDFIYIDDPRRGRLVFAYDDEGFLNAYDDKDVRIWRSRTDFNSGEWAIKDRLFLRNREVLLVKRIPFVEMVRGFGYKSSQIKNLRWDGFSIEEGVLIDDIKGSVLDFAVTNDRIFVLTRPMFGIKVGNILKGENPLRTILYIY